MTETSRNRTTAMAVQLDELLCPICLDEFKEPKTLSCMHDLCRKCLEDMAARESSRVIRCPLCRSEIDIPRGGVKNLPTNLRLMKLVESSPCKLAKAEIQFALGDCREKLAKISDVSRRISEALNFDAMRIKTQIHETAENIVELVRKQEKSLCKEVDDVIGIEEDSHAAAVLIRRTERLLHDIQEIIERDEPRDIVTDKDSLIGHLKDATSASTRLRHLYDGMEVQTSAVMFNRSRDFLQCVSSSMFGTVTPRKKLNNSTWLPGFNKDLIRGLEILKPGTRFRALQIPNPYENKFHPFAVACSSGGTIAVSDQGGHTVLLFNDSGEFLQSLGKSRGAAEGELECPSGVGFLGKHIVAVADGCLFGTPSRLQAFDSSGRFVRCLVKLHNISHWFTHIASIGAQRVMVTCRHVAADYEAYVQVFSTDGTVSLAFGASGDGKLANPVKAVYLDEEYFVSDFDKQTNCCVIKVFDYQGRYVRSFGECMLRQDVKDNPTYPLIIAADTQRKVILAYSGLLSVIRCYKPDGSLLCYYSTISGITDLALTNDRRLFVTCDGSGEYPHSVQILFHI